MTTLAVVVDATHIALAADRRFTTHAALGRSARMAESKLKRVSPWCVIATCGSAEFSTWLHTVEQVLRQTKPKNGDAALREVRKFLDPWHKRVMDPTTSSPMEKPDGIIITPWWAACLDETGSVWPLDAYSDLLAYAEGNGHAAAYAAFRTLKRQLLLSTFSAASLAREMVEVAAEVDSATGDGVDVVVFDRLVWKHE